ncbi:MAG: MarR family transcriptional regulator [Promethearchaeota archaeon]
MDKNIITEKIFESKEFLTPIQHNLIKALKTNGAITRRELVKTLNIPRTTIYDNLLKLQKRKIIEKFTRNNGKRGRPLVFWKIKS